MKDKNKDGIQFLWKLGIVAFVIFLGFIWNKTEKVKINMPRPAPSVLDTEKYLPQKVNITLHPGQGRMVRTDFNHFNWKSTGPILVRARDGDWFGPWLEDGPGIRNYLDRTECESVEFWVPADFPETVTVILKKGLF